MIKSTARRIFHTFRRVAGVSQLEEAIRGSFALQSYAAHLEERNRTLAALSMPMLAAGAVTQEQILRFCALFAPRDVEGFEKTRLGNSNDGGYIFIDDFDPVAAVVSCGISNDVTCDLAFAEMGRPVIQFDHTVDGPPVPHRLFDFRKQAIDALGEIPGSVRLWEAARTLGDGSSSDLVLKIDIEGHEWATFANYPVEELKRFRQISCEFHGTSRMIDREYFTLCMRAAENLSKVFAPAHLHANNFVGFVNLMGVPLPEVFEVSFVNRAFYTSGGPQRGAPSAIDNPNNPAVPDLFLGSPFRIV